MAFLTLNGIPVPVDAKKPFSVVPVEIGTGRTRALDGSPRRSNQGIAADITGTSTPAVIGDAQALEALIDGGGDHWGYAVDLYSDKGFISGITGAAALNTGAGKYGTEVTLGSGGTLTLSGQSLSGSWILGFWYKASTTFASYLVFGSGTTIAATYVNGVLGSALALLSVASGAPVFTGTGGTEAVSDPFVYPFAPTSAASIAAWVAGMFALQQVQAWPDAKTLLTGGDEGVFTVEGLVTKEYNFMGAVGGSMASNAKFYDFDLMAAVTATV